MIVYQAINLVNGKEYIGQTRGSLSLRRYQHENAALNGSLIPFHCALRKYGSSNFKWTVLEECNSLESLNSLEEKYIVEKNSFSPWGYNLKSGGEGKFVSPEVGKKISLALTGKVRSEEAKNKQRISMKGRKLSLKTISKMKSNRVGMLGKKHSDQTKRKISVSKSGVPQKLETKAKISLALKGENAPSAKLTWEKVREIRVKYIGKRGQQVVLSREYQISLSVINQLVHNKIWVEKRY